MRRWELAQRSVRSLKSMVRLAYASCRLPGPRAAPRRLTQLRLGCPPVAGLSGGWFCGRDRAVATVLWRSPAAPDGQSAREADPNRVILYLDSAAPEKWALIGRALLTREREAGNAARSHRHQSESSRCVRA
jgi:hypothetical protein